jgi:hypothetical protein
MDGPTLVLDTYQLNTWAAVEAHQLHTTHQHQFTPHHPVEVVKLNKPLHGLAPRSADATHKPPETETHAMIAHHWSTTHGEPPERTLVPPTPECTQETPDQSLLANCNQEICCGDQVTLECS